MTTHETIHGPWPVGLGTMSNEMVFILLRSFSEQSRSGAFVLKLFNLSLGITYNSVTQGMISVV